MSPTSTLLTAALSCGVLAAAFIGGPASAAPPEPVARVDYATQIQPIFARACVSCHGPQKAQGGLQLQSGRRLAKGGISDDLLVPGKPGASYLLKRLRGEGGEDRMPLKGKALAPEELALFERWVAEGAVLPNEPPPEFIPAPGGLKRLTVSHYQATVRDLFGENVPVPAHLEPDTLVSGSATVGAARVDLSPYGVEKYARAADELARRALDDADFRGRFVSCQLGSGAGALDEPCLRAFIQRFGRRAWRRPLAAEETERYLALGRAAGRRGGAAGGTRSGVQAVITGMLQSPNFLYRSEIGRPDPTDPRRRRLDPFELASRLSYFLWGAPPDEELLTAAEKGQLDTAEGLDVQTRRLLASSRARSTMSGFFLELFRLRRLDRISESRTKYKQYTPTLGASMRGETLKVIEEIAFDPKRDFREIFSAGFTYVNPEMARLYGVQPTAAKAPAKPDDYVRVELPAASRRVGVLGHGSFLTIFAHSSSSSPTKRGKFIRESLLCQAVPPPPPDVETRLPKDKPGAPPRTTRQKLEAHRESSRCNGCHKSMDPLGLAFENFDGIGAFRASEAGMPIDTRGELDGETFTTPAELGALLGKSPRLGACVARALFRYALGHLESEGEEPLMEELARGLARDGYKFPSLVANVIKSEGFRTIRAPDKSETASSDKPASKLATANTSKTGQGQQ